MSKNKTETNHDALTAAAKAKVAAFEAVELGDVWAEAHDQAKGAVEELRSEACKQVFPESVRPIGSDVLADLESYVERFSRERFTAEMIDLHAASLEHYPKLCGAIRGPLMRRQIGEVASARVEVTGRLSVDLVEAALREFEDQVSRQLDSHGELQPASSILATTIPSFNARIDAALSKQKKHSAEALERSGRERKEADEVLRKEAELKQKKLDKAVADAKAAVSKKERDATKQRSCDLANRIDLLGVETIRLEQGRAFGVAHITGSLRMGLYSAAKVEVMEGQVERFTADLRAGRVRIDARDRR